ncbi:hypothetical protein NUW58_g2759 [Xylaria curta]|uniref:Uncharacterized protein n=1 Tax=Xylaria curta TaxID=42375 RepID=A0ACC1PH78_9PEZI|nr:hypothetical protein NUW58_g2759 [Xylaria curta]
MPHAVSMPATGLQALILCGPGSSFPTFTTNPDENPKALLPVANRPMVWYPIDFCYRTGITSTAEILRLPEIRDLVKCDLVVLPCDLVCEIGGDKLLQAWMVKAASLPSLLGEEAAPFNSGGLGVWYETKTANPVKGEETDFLAITPMSGGLTSPANSILPHLSYLNLSMPTDSLNDLVEAKNTFPLRHGLLRKHPKLRILTTHRDAHIYFLPKWIMELVNENDKLETIGEDVVGWWAKATWQTGLSERLGLMKVLQSRTTGPESTGSMREDSPTRQGEISNSQGSDSPFSAEPKNARNSLLDKPQAAIPPVLAYIHPSEPDAPLLRRVDTTQLLLAVSLRLAKLPPIEETGPDGASPFAHPKKIAYPDGVKPRTTITRQDCLIANNVMVDEKTSIKECVVGANCQIKEGAKLFQCLLMDDVVVGKGCKLTRCILGRRSNIGEGSTLTDSDDKDNKLMSSSGLEASDEDMQDVLHEYDDGDASNGPAFG